MKIFTNGRMFRVAPLLAALALVGAGCGDAPESAGLDCEGLLRRVKDGVLDLGRRHKREKAYTAATADSLRQRIDGYREQLAGCDGTPAETVAKIRELLDQIAEGGDKGRALDTSVAALVAEAETLPVEATPAAAYDD